jgi:hypothetical protein
LSLKIVPRLIYRRKTVRLLCPVWFMICDSVAPALAAEVAVR